MDFGVEGFFLLGSGFVWIFPSLAGLLAKLFGDVIEADDNKSTRAASRVEHSFPRLRVEHFDRHLHDVACRKELAPGTLQGGADDGFVGNALDIHRRVNEIILFQLGDDEGDDRVIEKYALDCVGEKWAELFAGADFAEELLDAVFDFLLAGWGVALIRIADSESGTALMLLIFDFGEQDFEKLPKNLFFGTALVGVDEVVTPFESVEQVVTGGHAQT